MGLPIDVGAAAENYDTAQGKNYTYVDVDNPANLSGIITEIDVYIAENSGSTHSFYFGTFSGAAPTFTRRAKSANLGNLSAGFHNITGLNIAVEAGDFVGIYLTSDGNYGIDQNTSGGAGVYYKAGDQMDAGAQTYTLQNAVYKIAVYARGIASEEITADESESAEISDLFTPDHMVDAVNESASIADSMEGLRLAELVPETASIADQFSGDTLSAIVPESANISDNPTRMYEVDKSSSESAAIADSFGITYTRTVSESLGLSEELIGAYPLSIAEAIFMWDELRNGWGFLIDENLTIEDALTHTWGWTILEYLWLIDTQTNNWTGQEVLNDNLNLWDISLLHKVISDTVDESLVVTDTNLYSLTVTILEYLGFSELVSAMKSIGSSVDESLVLTDEAQRIWELVIAEALSTIDTNSVISTFLGTIQEALVFTDASSMIAQLGQSISESLVLTETISNKGTLYTIVYDTLAMNVTVALSGETWECYVLNTPRFEPSMYSGFNFNSYCVFENRAFGANDTGIYELTGTTDAGSEIHTGAILSQTDFGSRNYKRFRKGYIGVTGTSPVMVFECEDGSRQVYDIDSKGRVVISHAQKSKEWKLSLAEFDSLGVIKLIPVILTK